jgi:hypothetical protein
MSQILKPVETPVGIVTGRDGFYLDDICFKYQGMTIRFEGEINGKFCSHNINKEWVKFSLDVSGVLGFLMNEVDFDGTGPHPPWRDDVPDDNNEAPDKFLSISEEDINQLGNSSSFLLVHDSIWLEKMRREDTANKVKPHHRHLIFRTYDYVFDIVCADYSFSLDL